MAVLRDLAELTHWLSVINITPEAANDPTIGPEERARGRALAERLSMRVLARTWQMLLKALEEVALSPNAMMAAEMAVIRLTHVADLPPPEDLVRRLKDATPPPAGPGGGTHAPAPQPGGPPPRAAAPRGGAHATTATALAEAPDTALAHYHSFDTIVALIELNRDIKLLVEVKTCLRLVSYSPGRITFQPTERAPRDLAGRLGQSLKNWTGVRWTVTLANEGGGETIEEAETAKVRALEKEALQHPMMQAVLACFPQARVTEIRTPQQIAAEVEADALPEVEDEWDPFEDD